MLTGTGAFVQGRAKNYREEFRLSCRFYDHPENDNTPDRPCSRTNPVCADQEPVGLRIEPMGKDLVLGNL